jgi:hypothetical protein
MAYFALKDILYLLDRYHIIRRDLGAVIQQNQACERIIFFD